MTTLVQSAKKLTTNFALLPAILALALGLSIITVAGHVQASALHDAAHDVRHSNGFPCH